MTGAQQKMTGAQQKISRGPQNLVARGNLPPLPPPLSAALLLLSSKVYMIQ
jgi:hypothetical protein